MAKDMRETRIEDLPGPKSKEELEEMKMPYEEYCRTTFDPGNEQYKTRAVERRPMDEHHHVYLYAPFRFQPGGAGGRSGQGGDAEDG